MSEAKKKEEKVQKEEGKEMQSLAPYKISSTKKILASTMDPSEGIPDSNLVLPNFVFITQCPKQISKTPRDPTPKHLSKTSFIGKGKSATRFLLALSQSKETYTPSFITDIGIDFAITTIENEKFHVWVSYIPEGQSNLQSLPSSTYHGKSIIVLFGEDTPKLAQAISKKYSKNELRGFIPEFHEGGVILKETNDFQSIKTDDAAIDAPWLKAGECGRQLLTACSKYVAAPEEEQDNTVRIEPETVPQQRCSN